MFLLFHSSYCWNLTNQQLLTQLLLVNMRRPMCAIWRSLKCLVALQMITWLNCWRGKWILFYHDRNVSLLAGLCSRKDKFVHSVLVKSHFSYKFSQLRFTKLTDCSHVSLLVFTQCEGCETMAPSNLHSLKLFSNSEIHE